MAAKRVTECRHLFANEGPRVPLLHGSAATEICSTCGAWRQTRRKHLPWRPAVELAFEFIDTEEDYEVEQEVFVDCAANI